MFPVYSPPSNDHDSFDKIVIFFFIENVIFFENKTWTYYLQMK